MFVLEVEQGQAVFIPNELRQDDLPLSFKYYDPILRIINQECSDDRKEYFALKNDFDLNKIFHDSLKA